MNESWGSKREPLAISRPSLRGPQPRDDALGCAKDPQNATGVQPSAFGGFGAHAPGATIRSVVSRLHLQREACTNGHGKTTSIIPLIIFVFAEFSSFPKTFSENHR